MKEERLSERGKDDGRKEERRGGKKIKKLIEEGNRIKMERGGNGEDRKRKRS